MGVSFLFFLFYNLFDALDGYGTLRAFGLKNCLGLGLIHLILIYLLNHL